MSCTRPDVVDADEERTGNKRVERPEREIENFPVSCEWGYFVPNTAKTLSAKLYSAQMFGAQ